MKNIIMVIVLTGLIACGQGSIPSAMDEQGKKQASTEQGEKQDQPQKSTNEDDWEQTLAAAKKEGVVVISAIADTVMRNVFTSFSEDYPEIKVEYTGSNGASFWPRINKEREVNQYLWDVRIGSPSSEVYIAKNNGFLDPIRSVLKPEITNDGTWIGGLDGIFGDHEKKYVLHWATTKITGFNVNHDFIPEGQIKSMKDLLDPQYKGKIVLFDPRSGGGSGNEAMASYLLSYGEDVIKELFTNQDLVVSSDKRQMAEWVIRGRYPIAIGLTGTTMIEFTEKGLGKNVKTITEPGFAGGEALILFNKAPNPNAAKVFINWLLSEKVQNKFSEATHINSRRTDVKPVDNTNVINSEQAKDITYMPYEKNMQAKLDVAELAKKYLK
ncbi:ABC transporter substrate-binding protein [Paenibacillus sp. PvR148]